MHRVSLSSAFPQANGEVIPGGDATRAWERNQLDPRRQESPGKNAKHESCPALSAEVADTFVETGGAIINDGERLPMRTQTLESGFSL